MLISVPDVLSAEEVRDTVQQLTAADWVDGRITAGHQSAKAKNNMQLPEAHPLSRTLGERIVRNLERTPLFLSAALPLKVFPPLFNRYSGGQAFGTHVDNAIRQIPGTAIRVRTDLSATLFLSDPDSYEGGELCMETNFGVQNVKLPAGSLVLYPASSLHHVKAVTKGERLASFFWIESMIRDESVRSALFDLDLSIQKLNRDHPDHASIVQLTGVYHNFMRIHGNT